MKTAYDFQNVIAHIRGEAKPKISYGGGGISPLEAAGLIGVAPGGPAKNITRVDAGNAVASSFFPLNTGNYMERIRAENLAAAAAARGVDLEEQEFRGRMAAALQTAKDEAIVLRGRIKF